MKVRQIEVNIGRTINLGNFESARVEVSMTADLDPGDDVDESFVELYAEVNSKVRSKVEGLRP